MPLTDWINLNPAPEATGGDTNVISGGYYDPQALAAQGPANAFSFYNAANTTGITPFEAAQIYQNVQNPANVYVPGSSTFVVNPSALSATQSTSSGLPSNIFAGPISGLGLAGLGANALYNLGTAGYNYATGQGSMPLSSMTGGNISLGDSGLSLGYTNIPSSSGFPTNIALGTVPVDPAVAAQQAMANAAWNATIGTPNWTPTVGQAQPTVNADGSVTITIPGNTPPQTGTQTGSLGTTPGVQTIDPFYVAGGGMSTIPQGLAGTANLGLSTSGLGYQGAMGPSAAATGVTTLDPFKVTDPTLQKVTLSGLSGLNTGTNVSPLDQTGGTTQLPPYVTSATPATQPDTRSLLEQIRAQYPVISDPSAFKNVGNVTQLPPVTVTGNKTVTPTTATTTATSTKLDWSNINPSTAVGPFAPAKTTSTSTGTTTLTNTGKIDQPALEDPNLNLGSLVNTAIGTDGLGGGRNFPRELAASTAALRANQGNIMGMYGDIYQNLLGQTMLGNAQTPGLTSQIQGQLNADAAKLQRIQQGQLAAEDIRNAQQGAREAYAARGQVMGPGAVSAEILNREAIRQQREDQARAAYQSSMGNALNATQLQTGNIFSPIGSLVGQTFNPLGAYPQDVYSSNFNAALAQQISAMNNAAAIEAAKYGANASKQAATTSGLFNIGANLIANYLPKI